MTDITKPLMQAIEKAKLAIGAWQRNEPCSVIEPLFLDAMEAIELAAAGQDERAVEADKTKERQRIELGVIEFHPKDGLREEFYRVIDDLTEAGSAVDVWLMDIATVLKEHGYSMEIYKDKT